MHNVFFASPADLNDPFELTYQPRVPKDWNDVLAQLREILNKPTLSAADRTEIERIARLASIGTEMGLGLKSDEMNAFAEAIAARVRASTRAHLNSYGIFSLSAVNDSVLMWSHYADNHRGICVEFDSERDPKLFERYSPVQYIEAPPSLAETPVKHRSTADAGKIFLCKSSHWSYEQEWRILKREAGPWTAAPEALTGVVFGCQISVGDRLQICQWLGLRLNTVALSQARRSDSVFRLDIEPVSAPSLFLDLLPDTGWPPDFS